MIASFNRPAPATLAASLTTLAGHLPQPHFADLRALSGILRPGESFGPRLMNALTAHGLQPAHLATLTGLLV